MKKRIFKTIIVAAVLCLSICGLAACAKASIPGSGGSAALSAVDPETITVTERTYGIVISWDDVERANSYELTCNEYKMTTKVSGVNITSQEGFVRPADGVFNFTIVAKSKNYGDSAPTNYTYTVKGVKLNSPEIKSFDGGVLEWAEVAGASAYKVKVNGEVVSDNYRELTLDTKTYASGKSILVEIKAIGDGSKYYLESDFASVGVNAARTKLVLFPVSDLTVENGVLSWPAVSNAKAYRIVDIDLTVADTIVNTGEPTLQYDMTKKKLVLGVYPVSSSELISDADLNETVDIAYLNGKGTLNEPYEINTPFDLRAIDYYEFKYAEAVKAAEKAGTAKPKPNQYMIMNDIDFNSVAALDADSNIFTLTRPFYGVLDGGNKKLSNIRVMYDGGYWALFDYIVKGGTVKNIVFDSPEINNELQDKIRPINASISTVANTNYGTISGITVTDAKYTASGGEVSGICAHNYGTVDKCVVSGEFKQEDTELYSQACYEMAGVVLENYGVVSGNTVSSLTIRGTESSYPIYGGKEGKEIVDYGHYNNVRTVGGIVSVNRASGEVTGNKYGAINLIRMLNDYGQTKDDQGNYKGGGYEFGGIVGYNAGKVYYGSDSNFGTFTWSETDTVGAKITRNIGSETDHDLRGYIVGKSNGTVSRSK